MVRRRATLADIARELKMSPSTVSRALAGHPRVSQATTEAVRVAAAKLNYRPNSLAASLRRGSSQLIGVLVPRINRAFFASIIHAVETAVGAQGYSLIVVQSRDEPGREAASLQALMRAQVDGIIASLAADTTQYGAFTEVMSRGIPLVLCDRVTDQLATAAVVVDDFEGARAATAHLLEQGCRYPVHLAGPQHLNIYADRLAGFRAAIKTAGLPFNPHQQILMTEHTAAGGRAAGEVLHNRPDPPDGIFSASDWAATGAMGYLRARGVRVPTDVAIVGFANEPFTEYLEPPLSTVEQQSSRIGQRAAECLLAALDSGTTPAVARSVVPAQLIIRGSSQR